MFSGTIPPCMGWPVHRMVRFFFTGCSDNKVKAWDGTSGKLIHTFECSGSIASLDVSNDSRWLAVAAATSGEDDAEFAVSLFNLQNYQKVATLEDRFYSIKEIVFSPDSRSLAAAGESRVILWDISTGEKYTSYQYPGIIFFITFSPDGKQVAVGGDDNTIRLLGVESGRQMQILKGHVRAVGSLAYSPDGRRAASAPALMGFSSGRTVRLWEPISGLEMLSLNFEGEVNDVEFTPNGQSLLAASSDNSIRILRAHRSQTTFSLTTTESEQMRLRFSPDNRFLYAWEDDGECSAWDMVTGRTVDAGDVKFSFHSSPARSPDGRWEARLSLGPWFSQELTVTDLTKLDPKANHWPLPDRDDRLHYHSEKAKFAEQNKRHFAAAFHLDRILRDDPDNADDT